ncbi:hypothetical protein MRB53_028711 [Persea americana]|uniref:Uncharacterized protein n=1 Tax=Persea americana TaxID=3435 RepID=A0ACC2KGN8_PERAE|nr:hypothetical protein MRB53_028711 [Persea americana]
MKVGSKVIFLSNDADGFGSAISDALQPNPDSSLQRSVSCFDLSLEGYGIKDQKASGKIVNFIDPQGSIKVSILLLQKYEPPIAACAVNEVLQSIIIGANSFDLPTVILPFIVSAQKINREMTHSTLTDQKVTIYGAQIGNTADFTQTMISGLPSPSPSLPISCESLACLLQLVRVLKLPTVVLIGSSSQPERTAEDDLLALYEMGAFLANHFGLCFSTDEIRLNLQEKTRGSQEAWRALYG